MYVFQNKKFWWSKKILKNVKNDPENATWKNKKWHFLLKLSNFYVMLNFNFLTHKRL